MGRGRALADFVNFSDGFHEKTSVSVFLSTVYQRNFGITMFILEFFLPICFAKLPERVPRPV
jgi:hypothetical protein